MKTVFNGLIIGIIGLIPLKAAAHEVEESMSDTEMVEEISATPSAVCETTPTIEFGMMIDEKYQRCTDSECSESTDGGVAITLYSINPTLEEMADLRLTLGSLITSRIRTLDSSNIFLKLKEVCLDGYTNESGSKVRVSTSREVAEEFWKTVAETYPAIAESKNLAALPVRSSELLKNIILVAKYQRKQYKAMRSISTKPLVLQSFMS